MARETWTDERLDDLTKHMDEGFREVRADLREQREQVTSMRKELGELKAEVKGQGVRSDEQQANANARFDEQRNHTDTGFNALMRTMQIGFSLIGVMIAGLMTLVGIWL